MTSVMQNGQFNHAAVPTSMFRAPKVEISLQMITPAIAKNLLELNTSNRPCKQDWVDKIAAAMVRGDFEFNGDTVRISSDHVLLDGQHRLLACVKSGVPFWTILVENLDYSVSDTIDQGVIRGVMDILKMTYGRTAVNGAVVQSMGTLLYCGLTGNQQPSRAEVAQYIDENFDAIQMWATWATSVAKQSQNVVLGRRVAKGLAPGPVGTLAMVMLSKGASGDDINDFFRRVSTGNISDSDTSGVVEALGKRQRNGQPLNRIGGGGGGATQLFNEFSIYMRAFHYWKTNKAIGKIVRTDKVYRTFDELPDFS